jgi:hypothetical protein
MQLCSESFSLYYKAHSLDWALLQLEPAKLESEIASMVSDGSVYAKGDQRILFDSLRQGAGSLVGLGVGYRQTVAFGPTTSHLIHKENMTAQ